MTILKVQEKVLRVKATNGSASLGDEDIIFVIQKHLFDEIKAKLCSDAKNQDTEDFINRVKGDPAALS